MAAVFLTSTPGAELPLRICAEFDLQSARYQIVELESTVPRGVAQMQTQDGVRDADEVANFAIDGRRFIVRREPPAASAKGAAPLRLAKRLTVREAQIVELVAVGLRNKQIATHLQLSEYTVAAYVKQICQKLDVHNRTAVAARWLHDAYRHCDRDAPSIKRAGASLSVDAP